MKPHRIDHTAIVVADLDEAIHRYQGLFGLDLADRALIADQGIEMAFLVAGGSAIELITPTGSDSGVARFLERRGESLHHVAFLVDDLEAELDELHAAGIPLIDNAPRRGAHGEVAFIHPKGTGGVLIELVQNTGGAAPG